MPDLFTTEPFTLVGTQCESGHSSFPTRDFCPVCYSTDVQPIELPPSGTVETFTTVHQARSRDLATSGRSGRNSGR
ncbi:Zn-ribbon domain-containing OB-fold protein [Rhodococcus wratislaviensis]|nr:zinc ribbon domain-containing protein [Rhodococcus wratislaviensis]